MNRTYKIEKDGTAWSATNNDFTNLMESPAGFGDTPLQALQNLIDEMVAQGRPHGGPAGGDPCQCELCEEWDGLVRQQSVTEPLRAAHSQTDPIVIPNADYWHPQAAPKEPQ
jgi:hypothetical protein